MSKYLTENVHFDHRKLRRYIVFVAILGRLDLLYFRDGSRWKKDCAILSVACQAWSKKKEKKNPKMFWRKPTACRSHQTIFFFSHLPNWRSRRISFSFSVERFWLFFSGVYPGKGRAKIEVTFQRLSHLLLNSILPGGWWLSGDRQRMSLDFMYLGFLEPALSFKGRLSPFPWFVSLRIKLSRFWKAINRELSLSSIAREILVAHGKSSPGFCLQLVKPRYINEVPPAADASTSDRLSH